MQRFLVFIVVILVALPALVAAQSESKEPAAQEAKEALKKPVGTGGWARVLTYDAAASGISTTRPPSGSIPAACSWPTRRPC